MLSVIALLGLHAYCKQLVHGLVTTGMTDQVSWGLYIANFTFLVGMAAAAVMLVIPVYIYGNKELHDLVIFGELLAVAAIVMCLMFVTVDLGPARPLPPPVPRFNFPISMLTWDVVVLNGYLLLNLHICGYLIYCAVHAPEREPSKALLPAVRVRWRSCGRSASTRSRRSCTSAWAADRSGTRPIIAPRFLASAFAAGPAFLILTLQVIDRFTALRRLPIRRSSRCATS